MFCGWEEAVDIAVTGGGELGDGQREERLARVRASNLAGPGEISGLGEARGFYIFCLEKRSSVQKKLFNIIRITNSIMRL